LGGWGGEGKAERETDTDTDTQTQAQAQTQTQTQTQTQKEPALRLGKPEGFSFARQIGRGGATSIGFACAASEQNRGSGVDTASKNNSHWNKSVFSVCLYIHKHTYYGTDFGHCQTMVQTLDTATCLGQDARGKASEGDVVEGG
jgi:hypothetical protein